MSSCPLGHSEDIPPLILWNQRWEYDKRPDLFFELLYRVQEAGIDFRLAVAGENFRNVPSEFEEARIRLDNQIVHWGYIKSYCDYASLLQQADLVISTAIHEFFGVSILEATIAGAFPLLPNRLSYPELIPKSLHAACLYDDPDELFYKTCQRLQAPRKAPPSLQQHIRECFDWKVVVQQLDELLIEIIS
ncbi:glycosyltransferase [Chloroflexi bacterium TSY]|nr:glycosyltransferase [Chloroflexi bacterium TSY]